MEKGEFVGEGSDKIVREDVRHPDRVIKEYKTEKAEGSEVVARGYLAKILNILMPDNIPYLHKSLSQPHQIVEDKKQRDEEHIKTNELLARGDFEEHMPAIEQYMEARDNDPRIIELKNRLDEIGIDYDESATNFAFDEKGNAVYLDSVEPWFRYESDESLSGEITYAIQVFFNSEKLLKAIESIPDEAKREQARTYFVRLSEALKREQEFLAEQKTK